MNEWVNEKLFWNFVDKLEAAIFLLEHGADVNATNVKSKTALQYTAYQGNIWEFQQRVNLTFFFRENLTKEKSWLIVRLQRSKQ